MSGSEFAQALRDSSADETALADFFEVNKSTVRRWKCGTSVPHPRLRKTIVDKAHELEKAET